MIPKIFAFFLLISFKLCNCIEPFTIGFSILGGLAALGYNYDFIKGETYCRISECCTDQYIPANTNVLELRMRLGENIFGQHIVIENVVAALKSHYKNIETSIKPLVMTFHGTPGTGKNYVSDIIAKTIYKKGLESKYVHKFIGRADFPISNGKNSLVSQVIKAVSACPQSLIIIDEIDKLPRGVFDSLTTVLDHHHSVDGVNFRKAVFIFLTNTGGISISKVLAREMKNGLLREGTKLQHFEKLCQLEAFNKEGGMKECDPIKASLIDHYIPFLPLEEIHIRECIKREFRRLDYGESPNDIQEIVDQITFEDHNGMFATSGCKLISKKAEILTELRKI